MVLSRGLPVLVLLSLVVLTTACAEIRLTTVETHDRVLSRHKKVVPGDGVRVRSRISGTTLVVQTTQGCDLVEMEEVERFEVQEADEDLTEEFVILGVALVPLVSGIVMLADAPNVYGHDRNERLYNPVGQDGAYVGGTILTAVGGLLAMVPIIELLRIASAGEERQELVTRQGPKLAGSVPCEGAPAPVRATVTLRLAGSDVHTPGTDSSGVLEIDLARTIPQVLARRATTVQVLVAGRVVGELDIGPILDAQREQERIREADAWRGAQLERCRLAPAGDAHACRALEDFVERYPDGLHADEARELLAQKGRARPPVIASDDPEDAIQRAIGAARADLEADRREVCGIMCEDACEAEASPPSQPSEPSQPSQPSQPGQPSQPSQPSQLVQPGQAPDCYERCLKEVCP